MNNIVFGRRRSPLDLRDHKLSAYLPRLRVSVRTEREWLFTQSPLDQLDTPHCVGFSMADFLICAPVVTQASNDDGHRFYSLCKTFDGDNEDGSTLRSAAKALKALGKINSYAFAYSLPEVKYYLLHYGPVIAGTIWTEGMMYPNEKTGAIIPNGAELGGHAWLLTGYRNRHYIGQNSWGEWGLDGSGKFLIHEDYMSRLFGLGSEFLAAMERAPIVPQTHGR